jgi:hypothetical protein
MKKLKAVVNTTWAILYCVFTDPMTDHTIHCDQEGNVRIVHGHTWTRQELWNHFFGPRIDR